MRQIRKRTLALHKELVLEIPKSRCIKRKLTKQNIVHDLSNLLEEEKQRTWNQLLIISREQKWKNISIHSIQLNGTNRSQKNSHVHSVRNYSSNESSLGAKYEDFLNKLTLTCIISLTKAQHKSILWKKEMNKKLSVQFW